MKTLTIAVASLVACFAIGCASEAGPDAPESARTTADEVDANDPAVAREVASFKADVWSKADLTTWVERHEAGIARLSDGQQKAIVREIKPMADAINAGVNTSVGPRAAVAVAAKCESYSCSPGYFGDAKCFFLFAGCGGCNKGGFCNPGLGSPAVTLTEAAAEATTEAAAAE